MNTQAMARTICVALMIVLACSAVLPTNAIPSGIKFDYIVAGAGTAGCITAARLSEDPTKRVLLMGNGDDYFNEPFTAIPLGKPVPNVPGDFVRFADAVLSIEGPNIGRRSNIGLIPRALGGASMLNGGVFQHVAIQDIARLASLGINGWSVEHIAELWKRIETFVTQDGSPAPPGHGTSGPIMTRAITPEEKLEAIMYALQNITGTAFVEDMGLGNINGTGIFVRPIGGPANVSATGDFIRQDSWTRYVKPHTIPGSSAYRPNLHVLRNVQVLSVTRKGSCKSVNHSGDRCINAVTYLAPNGELNVASVRRGGQVILSTGALESPRILFHSGIGDCTMISSVGQGQIDCLLHNPRIGSKIYDHYLISQIIVAPGSPSWSTHIGSIIGAYYPVMRPDGAVNIETAITSQQQLTGRQAYIVTDTLTNPLSHGSLKLKQTEWTSPLNVSFGVMQNVADVYPLLQAFKNSRQSVLNVLGSSAILYSPSAIELPLNATDTAILTWILGKVTADYHTVASTPMGVCGTGEPYGAVVDEELRYCGLDGLRGGDLGIWPFALASHSTDACARTIGEQLAYLIRGY